MLYRKDRTLAFLIASAITKTDIAQKKAGCQARLILIIGQRWLRFLGLLGERTWVDLSFETVAVNSLSPRAFNEVGDA